MSTRKRKKRLSFDSSSEDDDSQETSPQLTGKQDNDCNTRSSERINKRQNRNFHIPSREDVWNKILPTESPDKYYLLKPRKLVNNFTKENNSYNYDPNITSGSESMDNFIDDDIQYRSRKKKKKPVHRIKQRHSRVVQESSDSDTSHADESADETNDTNSNKHSGDDGVPANVSTSSKKSNVDEGFSEGLCLQEQVGQSENPEIENKSGITVDACNVPDDEPELNIILTRSKARKKTNKLESGDEENPDACNTETSNTCPRLTKDNTDVGANITNSESSITDSKINISIIEEEEVKNITNNKLDDEKLESDNDSNFEVNLQNFKRRRSNILDSDTEDEGKKENEEVDKQAEEDFGNDNAGGNTANIEDDKVDGENMDDVKVLIDGNEVHVINSDDSNDSFVVDDDSEDDYIVVGDEEEDFDNDDETSNDDSESDSEDESVCCRKKTVRVKMVQKKKERDDLFEQLREARNRRKSKEICENDND